MYDAWSQGVSGLTLWRCGTATRGSVARGAEGMGPFLLLSAVGPPCRCLSAVCVISQVVTFLRIDQRQCGVVRSESQPSVVVATILLRKRKRSPSPFAGGIFPRVDDAARPSLWFSSHSMLIPFCPEHRNFVPN